MRNRILVIEDDEPSRQLIAVNLERQGWLVDLADSADAARERIRQVLPDLIILDMFIQNVPTKEFLGELKANPETRAIPLIMLSPSARTHDVWGTSGGYEAVLTKPPNPVELVNFAKRIFRTRENTEVIID